MPAYAFSHPGLQRQENQDNFLLLPGKQCWILAVADGLGGHQNGELASRKALEYLEEFLENENNFTKDTVYRLLTELNRKVYSLQEEGSKKSATTLSLVWLRDREFLVGHVGDSRVYWWEEGGLSLLTQDQTVLNQWASQGNWVPERYYQKFGHILARTLGGQQKLDQDFMEQDVFSYVLGPFQFKKPGLLLLATDGLSKHLTEGELESLLAENFSQPPEKITKILLTTALERGGEDNITLIVKKIEGGQ